VLESVFFKAVFRCQNDILKFCNDTLNSESQEGMVLPCIEVKRFEKTCFPACDYCNMGCNDRPTQFSGSEVGSGNYKNSICALSCAPLRFGLLLSFRRFVVYENVKAL